MVIPESKISVSLIGEDGAILTMMILLLKRTISEKKCLPPVHQPVISMLPISMLRISLSRIVPAEWGRQWPVLLVEIALISKLSFLGNQDTLYTYGKDSRQFYDHCYIEGTVDFILAGLRHCLRIAPSIVWVMGMLPLLLQIKAKIWLCFYRL